MKALSPMFVTAVGASIEIREVQPLNASVSIRVTVVGESNVTEAKEMLYLNAPAGMDDNNCGIFIDVRPEY